MEAASSAYDTMSICDQMVRLHINKAGRRHVFTHARKLYEGSRFSGHYAAKLKCVGSGSLKLFDPRPNEYQYFKLPVSLLDEVARQQPWTRRLLFIVAVAVPMPVRTYVQRCLN